MIAKVSICKPCAGKLRAILESKGERAMAAAMGRTLCSACRARVNRTNGQPESLPLRFEISTRGKA